MIRGEDKFAKRLKDKDLKDLFSLYIRPDTEGRIRLIKTKRGYSDLYEQETYQFIYRDTTKADEGIDSRTYIILDFEDVYELGTSFYLGSDKQNRFLFYRFMASRFGMEYVKELYEHLTGFDQEFLAELHNPVSENRRPGNTLRNVLRRKRNETTDTN